MDMQISAGGFPAPGTCHNPWSQDGHGGQQGVGAGGAGGHGGVGDGGDGVGAGGEGGRDGPVHALSQFGSVHAPCGSSTLVPSTQLYNWVSLWH